MTHAIELVGVTKAYAGSTLRAVDDLSLSVAQGEIVTLLGPSGCGKTTTLRVIAGFERPDSGEVRLNRHTMAGNAVWMPAEHRGVGMVFQEHALFPHLTVARNVGFNLKGPSAATRVGDMLDLVGLAEFAERMPHELSGGQQQRVALARALAHDPVVVLMDEPFSSLDAGLRMQMRVEVRRILKEAGATAVLVSHDQRDALAISDEIIVMRGGRIEQAGTPREVYQSPRTRFVAEFVGTSNVLRGIVSHNEAAVETAIGTVPCAHTRGVPAGAPVMVSIRPDSLKVESDGPIEGRVISSVYAGSSTDLTVRVQTPVGTADLLTHAHPEHDLAVGQTVRLNVSPDYVALITE